MNKIQERKKELKENLRMLKIECKELLNDGNIEAINDKSTDGIDWQSELKGIELAEDEIIKDEIEFLEGLLETKRNASNWKNQINYKIEELKKQIK